MLAELRSRLGTELERLSRELENRMPVEPAVDLSRNGRGEEDEFRQALQRRIRLFGQLTAGLAAIDAANVQPGRAGYGSTVRVRDLKTGNELSYTLMTGDIIDLEEGQVSLESPIGHTLLGSRPGDQVTVTTPRGERRYEVVSVVTLAELLGMSGSDDDDMIAAAADLQMA